MHRSMELVLLVLRQRRRRIVFGRLWERHLKLFVFDLLEKWLVIFAMVNRPEGGENRFSDQLIEVVVVDFAPLELGHPLAIQGVNELSFHVLSQHGRTFEQERASGAVAEVLHSDSSIGSDAVLFAEDPVDHLCVGVGQVKNASC